MFEVAYGEGRRFPKGGRRDDCGGKKKEKRRRGALKKECGDEQVNLK